MEHEATPVEHERQLPFASIYNPVLQVMQVVLSEQTLHPNGHFRQILLLVSK